MRPHLKRHLLALCVHYSDEAKAYVGSDDLRPLLAHQEQVGLFSEAVERVGNVHQDEGGGAVHFVLYDGPTYAAAVDLVRAALTCRHAEQVPLAAVP